MCYTYVQAYQKFEIFSVSLSRCVISVELLKNRYFVSINSLIKRKQVTEISRKIFKHYLLRVTFFTFHLVERDSFELIDVTSERFTYLSIL